ncbi:MAG: quinone-dependent dihydroorotate dehydrogenase [Caulobacteraceae bacterium]
MSGVHGLATRALRWAPPEVSHRLAIVALKAGLGPRLRAGGEGLSTVLAGMTLANPIGLAAGFDKNAEVPGPVLAAGFGFVECGTVTPLAQRGNPAPRLFRLTEDRALINRLGFGNKGLESFAARLAKRTDGSVIGANIGANRDSPDRVADYVKGITRLWGLVDYFVLNVSSPNTPGLRDLQAGSALEDLLGAVSEATAALRGEKPAPPLFLKVAPDLDLARIEAIVRTAVGHGLAGLVVSNTTVSRPAGLRSSRRDEAGGLSGAPLLALSTRLLGEFHAAAEGRLALIGTGGVAGGADAYAKIRAGASAVQIYSALVFQGPGLVPRIRRELLERLRADGFADIAQAVGAG